MTMETKARIWICVSLVLAISAVFLILSGCQMPLRTIP